MINRMFDSRTIVRIAPLLTLTIGSGLFIALTASGGADGPDFYEVRGVEPGEVVQLRSKPEQDAAKLGRVSAAETCLRNLGCEGGPTLHEFTTLSESELGAIRRERPRWCRVGLGIAEGWIQGRYLRESRVGCPQDRMGFDQSEAPNASLAKDSTYRGIAEGPVTLVDGVWEGEPYVSGGASRPSVVLVDGFHLVGDLSGDGSPEALVLLAENSGGSGTRSHLAVLGWGAEGAENLATSLVGDRVQIRSAWISHGRIEFDVVQAGPGDAACCPSQKARRTWSLGETGLRETSEEITGTLSIVDIAGVEWVLTRFAANEPAPAEPEVTLEIDDDRVIGSAGCNRYFAAIEEGPTPGDVKVGSPGSTRRACPGDIMALESRYLNRLGQVVKFGFSLGRLVLTWRGDDAMGSLFFEHRGRGRTAEDFGDGTGGPASELRPEARPEDAVGTVDAVK